MLPSIEAVPSGKLRCKWLIGRCWRRSRDLEEVLLPTGCCFTPRAMRENGGKATFAPLCIVLIVALHPEMPLIRRGLCGKHVIV
ncbi:hypothetical protein EXIGLDRAFT_92432 [Exidia glandulosa HHB12029]|uniref:Uncharacterized protein n=1 Tax=Exidia glandulosa HHB12029 TaxID=1314781 RepID=A0A165H9Z2_EXIGL|nr:hypothetical protein EXIGLDRAFT_92432 [Exidia glandulosa HHB12029]